MNRPPPGVFSKFFIELCICRTDIMSDVHMSRAPFPVTAAPLVNRQLCMQHKNAGYLSYSEADFGGFHPAGATRCTDGGKIGRGGGDRRFPHSRHISPHRCNNKGIGPQKLKFFTEFDQNVEYKRPQGRIACAIFTNFAEFVTSSRSR